MSASRTLLLASRSQKKEGSDDDDYDSEEERYQRNQDRLLQKVEESASAIRALTEITRPFVTGSWRLEREEKRNEELLKSKLASGLTPSKENKPKPLPSTSKKGNDPRNATSCSSGDGTLTPSKKSIWSPVKHVKTSGVSSLLEMEKTPNWRPLRKSKVRLSQAFSTENSFKSPSVCEEGASSSRKTLSECLTPSKSISKPSEELRTPLRTVASSNQSQLCRQSVSQSGSNDTSSVVEVEVSHEVQAAIHDSEAVCPKSRGGSGTQIPSAVQDEIQQEYPIHKTPRALKSFKSPVRCSPVLLQAYGKDHALVRGSIGSPDKVVNLDECHSPKDPSKVLKGVVAYVEVRRGEDDRTGGFRWKLKQLGATVSDTLNKKVTHVVFQEGLLSTFRKAKQINAHIVSTHWVMACDESFTKVSEARYPIEKLSEYELADPHIKAIKRPKIMSPDLGSGRDDKKLSRRFKAIERRSMKVESPLAKTSHSAMSAIEVPQPLSAREDLLRLSPKAMLKTNLELDDDWDGFLAMVEAQVREKAQSRVNNGDDSVMDFETKLQLYLGRKKAEEKNEEISPPLASIFQKGKTFNTVHRKASPKKVKKAKLALECTASSSVMMNWLQKRSPKSRDLSSVAASAAADEIIQSMFKCIETEQSGNAASMTKTVTSSNNMCNHNRANQCNQSVKLIQDSSEDTFVFTAKQGNKTAENTKRQVKNKKSDFKGSTASSGMMRNWLSGAKSPNPPQKSPVNVILKSSGFASYVKSDVTNANQAKRKASFDDVSKTNFCEGDSQTLTALNPSKKHCSSGEIVDSSCEKSEGSSLSVKIDPHQTESTPRKTNAGCPSKDSNSVKKISKKGSLALTPRRRSLRLTPMKTSLLSSDSVQLGTVVEGEVCKFEAGETATSESVPFICVQDSSLRTVTQHSLQLEIGRGKKSSNKSSKSTLDIGEEGFVTKRQTSKASSGRKGSSIKSRSTSIDNTVIDVDCNTPQAVRKLEYTKQKSDVSSERNDTDASQRNSSAYVEAQKLGVLRGS